MSDETIEQRAADWLSGVRPGVWMTVHDAAAFARTEAERARREAAEEIAQAFEDDLEYRHNPLPFYRAAAIARSLAALDFLTALRDALDEAEKRT